jgi:hypothetical protein
MGFLSRLFRKDASSDQLATQLETGEIPPLDKPEDIDFISISGNGTFDVSILGESHYQETLEKIVTGRSAEGDVELEAALVIENSKPHDPEAVCVQIRDQTVGYLAPETAREFRLKIGHLPDWNVPIVCQAQIRTKSCRGEEDHSELGVWLDFSGEEEFVAIDFETANPDFSSICQVGAVLFRGGQVASTLSTLPRGLLRTGKHLYSWHR